jgi:zinc transport system ATP-binding protein
MTPSDAGADAMARAACGGCCTRLAGVGVRLGGRSIIHDVNLHIHCGELTVLIGPNGAGKTTLFRAMLGEAPHTGAVQFYKPGISAPVTPVIGYVPQGLEYDSTAPFTVRDLFAAARQKSPIWLGRSRKAQADARAALKLFAAEHLLREKMGALSGGQLQRVLLALALTPVPDILLLDEPVAGIDPSGVGLFYHMISDLRLQYHISIIMVSHDIVEAARFADRMAFLNRTIVCEGAPADVLSHNAVIETFGHLSAPPAERPHGRCAKCAMEGAL